MKAIFNTDLPDLLKYNGQSVEVLRKSCDEIFGWIYKVRFDDGIEESVLAGELMQLVFNEGEYTNEQ